MSCCNCCKCYKCTGGLCALSFGLAIGIVAFFAVIIWSVWVMRYGMPPMMVGHMTPPTLSSSVVHALWALLKGFLFGFFVALFYDLMLCCKKSWKKCCKTSDGQKGSCPTCSMDKK